MEQDLRVRLLGGAELAVSGRPLVELASAKAAALLVYRAVTGTGHSRSALAGLLWSELPEQTARANLRLVLSKLRRVLPDHLEVTRQAVALASGQDVWVDAVEVARAAAGERDGGELLAAVRLCRGEFLEGFEVPGAPLFDEWLIGRRAAVRADMLAIMDRAVQLAATEATGPPESRSPGACWSWNRSMRRRTVRSCGSWPPAASAAPPWPSTRPAGTCSGRSWVSSRRRPPSPCATRSPAPVGSPSWATGH